MNKFSRVGLILLIFFSLIFSVKGEIELGIWPAKLNFTSKLFKNNLFNIFFFNMGEHDVKIKVEFTCRNLTQPFKIFGKKIGNWREELPVKIFPSTLTVRGGTSIYSPANATILIKNNGLTVKRLYLNEISIPFPNLVFGDRELNCKVVATSLEGLTLLSITSSVRLKLEGLNPLLIFGIISLVSLVIGLSVYLYYKKL